MILFFSICFVNITHVRPDLGQVFTDAAHSFYGGFYHICLLSSTRVENADGQYAKLGFFDFPNSSRRDRRLLIPAFVLISNGLYIHLVHFRSLILSPSFSTYSISVVRPP